MRIDYNKQFPPDKVRKRISYLFYKQLAQELQQKGISTDALEHVISYVHNLRASRYIYKYGSNAHWAQQSIDLLKKDLKLKK